MLVLPDAASIKNLKPNLNKIKELEGLRVAVTAHADQEDFDCISRVFAPKLGIPEDPVTGSTHCMITPYWCHRLRKQELICFQASERSGILSTKLCGDRVKVAGQAVLFSKGTILED